MLQRKQRHFRSRFVDNEEDLLAAQKLRFTCFNGGNEGVDIDAWDATSQHVLISDVETDQVVATFRFQIFRDGTNINQSYSAAFYDLGGLATFDQPLMELGRFCISDLVVDPNVMRLAWSEITKLVDIHGIEMMFGCSSFQGTDPRPYADSFAWLKERHQGPQKWLPKAKVSKIVSFANETQRRELNLKLALQNLPSLLRTYLTMGGWVSDHAVVDDMMNTLHVFTGVEISKIPESRKRLLRTDASS